MDDGPKPDGWSAFRGKVRAATRLASAIYRVMRANPLTLAGFVLVLIGSFLATRPGTKRQPSTARLEPAVAETKS